MLQDAEYVKIADKAWHEALEIAKSKDGWKVEKDDKELVGEILENNIKISCFLILAGMIFVEFENFENPWRAKFWKCKKELGPNEIGKHIFWVQINLGSENRVWKVLSKWGQ